MGVISLSIPVAWERHLVAWRVATEIGFWETVTLSMPVAQWQIRHGGHLSLNPSDLAAFEFLRKEHGDARGKVFVNFNPANPWGILFESTLCAETGLYPEGHALPLPSDPIGQPPGRMTVAAADFLHGRGTWLPSDWLYLRAPSDSAFWALDGWFRVHFQFKARYPIGDWEVRLYRRK